MTDRVFHQKRTAIMDEIHKLLNQVLELECSSQSGIFADKVPPVRRALAAKYNELAAFDARQ